jgi:plastocyanin
MRTRVRISFSDWEVLVGFGLITRRSAYGTVTGAGAPWENYRTMKLRAVLAALALVVASPAIPAGADVSSRRTNQAAPNADNFVFSGGGTPLSNGIFFPGTAVYDDQTKEYTGVPYSIEKGSDITFVNADEGTVANCHKMVSFKRKRGRPLFSSKSLCKSGEQSLVVTSNLQPGIYDYYCTIHFGMYGLLEVKG